MKQFLVLYWMKTIQTEDKTFQVFQVFQVCLDESF